VIRAVTAVLAPVVLLAGIVAAALHDDGTEVADGQARVLVQDGTVEVAGADGATREVTRDTTVVDGDRLRVTAGSATVRFADGATYELRHLDGVGSAMEVGSPPRLLAGDALLTEGFPAGIRVGTATLSAQGALKVDAEAELATAYEGRTRVAGAGDASELPALRRLVLVAGATPEPVEYDGADPWDRRFLGEAIAFGERLEALARGYTSDLPSDVARTADLYREVLPALAELSEFSDDLVDPARPPGETLVGAAIAVQATAGTFRERWVEVFAFRDAGAAWGLVALDQGVSSAPLLEAVELAVATPADGPAPARPADPPTPGGSATTSPTGPPRTTAPPPTTAPAPSPDPEPPPDPEPDPSPGGLLDPVLDPDAAMVQGLLDGLLGGG